MRNNNESPAPGPGQPGVSTLHASHPLFLKTVLGPGFCYYPHFMGAETDTGSYCSSCTAREAGSQSRAVWLQNLVSPGRGAAPLQPEELCLVHPWPPSVWCGAVAH